MSEFTSPPAPRPIPRPPLHAPAQPTSAEASNLERAFGFEELSFREYIEGRSTHKLSARRLTALAREMDVDVHPLVMYGAGWAAAEAACHRRMDSSSTGRQDAYEDRINALHFAEACWMNARGQFSAAEQHASTSVNSVDYRAFATRTSFALASLPLLDVIADWRTVEQVTGCGAYEAADEVSSNIAELALDVLTQRTPTIEHKWAQSGICNELLGCLLLQSATVGEGVVIPASLRQDHNRVVGLRSDLVKVSAKDNHRKTLVQVSGHTHKRTASQGIFVMYSKSMKLKKATNLETLAFVAREQLGESQPSDVKDGLDNIRKQLNQQLYNFEEWAFNSGISGQTKTRPRGDAQEPMVD